MMRRILGIALMFPACLAAAATRLPATADGLATAMQGQRVVLLGEVHDNAAQHALRVAALRKLVASGARPAIAFEQFDVGAQEAIDRARRERPGDADYLIAQAKGAPGWDWALYKPFVALALEYDLPIVAANLARADAMKTAMSEGAMDAPPALVRAQEQAVVKGHCDLLPPDAVPGMVRAQIARDRTLARAIAPYAERGVVLLTGNGHARKDMGVPRWLAAPSTSIGLLEDDDETQWFDAYVVTEAAARPDPCEELRKRFKR
ncbi:MAG: ChaN family lipoprotein [Burkholderiales bacterium]